jgi:hypothetical protein
MTIKQDIKNKKTGGRPTKHQERYKDSGRPSKMTPETLKKLENAFASGYTDEQACIFADISMPTLYEYIKKNPNFHNKKELLKKRVDIQAKTNLVKKIKEGDDITSKWWLERKCKDEFSTKNETQLSGEIKERIVYIEKKEKDDYEKHIEKELDAD